MRQLSYGPSNAWDDAHDYGTALQDQTSSQKTVEAGKNGLLLYPCLTANAGTYRLNSLRTSYWFSSL
jgi:hypothetical protein